MHAELGLLSLADRRVCLKLGYYQRLCDASEDRLLSLIFRRRHAEVERGAAPHSGLQSMRVAMADAGFAKEWRARDCGAGDWVSEVKLAVTERAALVQREEMAQRSTLAEYVRLGLRPLTKNALHLDDAYSSEGTKLMTKARLGHLLLMQNVARVCGWPVGRARCVLCKQGVEDVRHFLLCCPILAPCRSRLGRGVKRAMRGLGVPGQALRLKFQSGGDDRLRLMLGAVTDFSTLRPAGSDADAFRADCGKASWMMCKLAKNFLVAAWRMREAVLGKIQIRAGVLVRTPSKRNYDDEVCKQAAAPPTALNLRRYRYLWTRWQPAVQSRWSGQWQSTRRGRAAFYVVTGGRENGVMYQWRDVRRSIAGLLRAHVKGFRKEAKAYAYAKRRGVAQ